MVFLAGLTTKLVHDQLQIRFALNDAYCPGDGKNLHFTDDFAIVPQQFRERVEEILHPGRDEDAITSQRIQLMALIDEVLAPVPQESSGHTRAEDAVAHDIDQAPPSVALD